MVKILNPSLVIELICLGFAIFFLSKDKNTFWRMALAYMVFTCAVELTGAIISRIYHHHNVWFFNIYILFEAGFISYGLYVFLKHYINPALIVKIGSGLIFLSYCFELYKDGPLELHSITINISAVVFVIYGLYYFYVILKDDNFIRLKLHPEFWWVVGILFYYFGGTIINLFNDVFIIKITEKHYLRYYIYILLNLLLYSFWTYSFICRARQRKLPPY